MITSKRAIKIQNIVREELLAYPNISEDYIVWDVSEFFDPTYDESYQSREDVANIISSCLTKLGIKNEIIATPNCFTIKRLGDKFNG